MRDIVEEKKAKNVRPGCRRTVYTVVWKYWDCEGGMDKDGNEAQDQEKARTWRGHWLPSTITGCRALLFLCSLRNGRTVPTHSHAYRNVQTCTLHPAYLITLANRMHVIHDSTVQHFSLVSR